MRSTGGDVGRVEMHESPCEHFVLSSKHLETLLFLLSLSCLLLLFVPAMLSSEEILMLVEDHGDPGRHGAAGVPDGSSSMKLLLSTLYQDGAMSKGNSNPSW